MATAGPGSNPVLDYVAQSARTAADNTETALQIHQAMDQRDDAYNAAMIANSAMGGAEQSIISQKNALAAASDAKVDSVRVAFGADPTAQGSESNYWLGEMKANAHKAYEALDSVNAKKAINPLSDPLGYVAAQFTLPSDIATFNYYAEKHNVAESSLNEITQASDANVIAARRASATTSTELALAESDKAAQQTLLANAELKEKSAGARIVGLNELNNLNNQQLNIAFQLHSAQNSDKSLEMQRQVHQDMMDQRAERLKAKADSEAAIEMERQAYNAGARRMNKATIEDNVTFKNIYSRSYGKDAAFMATLGQGQDIQLNGGVTNGIPVASNAGEAALVMATGNTTSDKVGSFLVKQLATEKQSPTAPKDRAALVDVVNQAAVKAATGQKNYITDPTNIYAAPPPSVVMKAVGAASDPFLQETLADVIKGDPKASIPDGVLFGKALDWAKKPGGLNMAVDGLTTYYKLAVLQNDTLNQYQEKGLPPQRGSYNAVIDGKVINLTDPTAVRTALLMAKTKQMIAENPGFSTMLGGNN